MVVSRDSQARLSHNRGMNMRMKEAFMFRRIFLLGALGLLIVPILNAQTPIQIYGV